MTECDPKEIIELLSTNRSQTLNSKWFHSSLNDKVVRNIHRFNFQAFSKSKGLSWDCYLATQCEITFCAAAYIISGSLTWNQVDPLKLKSKVFMVSIEEDEHFLLVVGDQVYQSYWNKYSARFIQLTTELLHALTSDRRSISGEDYTAITGDHDLEPNSILTLDLHEPPSVSTLETMKQRMEALLL